MASDNPENQQLSEDQGRDFNCKICLERFTKVNRYPISLNCGHTFCRRCVRRLSHDGAGTSISCGLCRKNTYSDHRHLGKNITLTDLLEHSNFLEEDDPTEVDDELPMVWAGTNHFISSMDITNFLDHYSDIREEVRRLLPISHQGDFNERLFTIRRNLGSVEVQLRNAGEAFTTQNEQLDRLHEEVHQAMLSLHPSSSSDGFTDPLRRFLEDGGNGNGNSLRRSTGQISLLSTSNRPRGGFPQAGFATRSRPPLRHHLIDILSSDDENDLNFGVPINSNVENPLFLQNNYLGRIERGTQIICRCFLCDLDFPFRQNPIVEHVNGQRHRRLVQRNEEENFSILFGHNATDDASANEEINRIFGRHIFGGNRGGGIRNSWVGRGGSGRGREFRTGGRWSGRDDEDYDEDSVTDGFGNGGFGGRGGGRSGMGRGAFTGRGACTGGRGACTGGRGFGSRREGIGRHLRRHSASENDNNTFANGGFGARMEQNRNNGLGRFGSRGGGLRGATNNNTNANGGGLRGGRCSHINETTEDSWNPNPVDGWGGFDGENGFTNGGFGGGNRSEEFANGGFGRGRGRGATRNNTQRELASTTEEGDVFANSGFSTVAINNEQEPRNIGNHSNFGRFCRHHNDTNQRNDGPRSHTSTSAISSPFRTLLGQRPLVDVQPVDYNHWGSGIPDNGWDQSISNNHLFDGEGIIIDLVNSQSSTDGSAPEEDGQGPVVGALMSDGEQHPHQAQQRQRTAEEENNWSIIESDDLANILQRHASSQQQEANLQQSSSSVATTQNTTNQPQMSAAATETAPSVETIPVKSRPQPSATTANSATLPPTTSAAPQGTSSFASDVDSTVSPPTTATQPSISKPRPTHNSNRINGVIRMKNREVQLSQLGRKPNGAGGSSSSTGGPS